MKIKTQPNTIQICSAIVAFAFLAAAELGLAGEPTLKSEASKPAAGVSPSKDLKRGQDHTMLAGTKEVLATIKNQQKKLKDLRAQERAAQLDKFHKEHEQRAATAASNPKENKPDNAKEKNE